MTLCFKSNGDLYFTDPPYGLEGNNDDPAKELKFNGVVPAGEGRQGDAFDQGDDVPQRHRASRPTRTTLYVAQSDPKQPIWKAFEVLADGTLGKSRVFADGSAWAAAGRKACPMA